VKGELDVMCEKMLFMEANGVQTKVIVEFME
jgi:hypothetical protein